MTLRTTASLLALAACVSALPAFAQTLPSVSDAVLFQATLGTNLSDRLKDSKALANDDNSNATPEFTVNLGSQLLFGVAANATFDDRLTAVFAQDQTQGAFYTITDPNTNGTVIYPIGTRGGNSYRELLTFNRLGSFTGSINLNLAVANPDFNQTGGLAKVEAPTFAFRVNVVDPAVTAVPEPATWAMMLVGFAAVGAASRRRTRVRYTVA